MSENIIEINNLSKSFGEVKAVKNLSFKVKKGELFSFLGVNGAGKSTTISIICGTLLKDSGSVFVDGKDIDTDLDKIKSQIGVVFQNSLLDKPLTVKENIKNKASLYGIDGQAFEARYQELSNMFDLAEISNRAVGKLSGGQRRRVDIARALVHSPKILIMDEPTTGLDPQTRKALWQTIEKLRASTDLTVFLTTHYMEEAVDSNYVVILDKGSISACGTPIELKNKYAYDYITLYNTSEEQVKSLNLEYKKVNSAYRICVKDTKTAKQLIIENPDVFNDFEIVKGKMDDVFLAVTGLRLGEEN